jgi:hypothetical protein
MNRIPEFPSVRPPTLHPREGRRWAGLALVILATVVAAGCKPKAEADVAPLEKAFADVKPAAGQPSEQQQAVDLVAAALAAAKANDYPKAAASLTVLRTTGALTPDQRAAVQDAMSNVQSELARRADAGDQAAIKALDEIRKMQTR